MTGRSFLKSVIYSAKEPLIEGMKEGMECDWYPLIQKSWPLVIPQQEPHANRPIRSA